VYYIYEIKNLINGKNYIGQRKCPDNKSPETDTGYIGSGNLIKAAIKKYGKENFKKRIIIKDIYCKEIIDEFEKEFIAIYRELDKAEYNITPGREGCILYGENHPMYGKHHSEESKQKISEKSKGNRYNLGHKHTEETKKILSKKMKGENNPMYKHKHTEETKLKMSLAQKGIKSGENHPMYGKHHSEESKKRIGRKNAEKMKGKHWFNNGKKNILVYKCPEGFYPGMLKKVI
jgi:group I intron endonuclease